MNGLRRLVTGVIVVCFVFLAFPVFAGVSVKEGMPVPTFTMLDETGNYVDLAGLIDRPTIIYFTHNACWYCEQIIRQLKRAEAKFGKEKLKIIGVNVMAKDTELIKAYKEELGFTFLMLAGNRDDVLSAFKINYVPVLVFVDSSKTVRKVVGHYIHDPQLEENIRNILDD